MKHEQDSIRQLKIQNEALKTSDLHENRVHPKIIQIHENDHEKSVEKEIFHAPPPAAIKEENQPKGSKYEFGKVVKITQSQYDHTRGTPTDPVLLERRDFVRKMMKHAWGGYKQKAWGYNEVQPKSGTPSTSNIFGKAKTGATIIDGLDTLWIMGLEEEFYDGRRWVQESFNLRGKFLLQMTNKLSTQIKLIWLSVAKLSFASKYLKIFLAFSFASLSTFEKKSSFFSF